MSKDDVSAIPPSAPRIYACQTAEGCHGRPECARGCEGIATRLTEREPTDAQARAIYGKAADLCDAIAIELLDKRTRSDGAAMCGDRLRAIAQGKAPLAEGGTK